MAVKVTAQPPIWLERCVNKEWQVWQQRSTLWTKKNVEKTGFPGFSGKLQGNVSQFYCIAPVKLKLTGYLPTLACKVYQKRKRQLHAEKLRFGPKISKNGFFGFSVTHYNHSEFYCVTPRSLKLTNVLPYWRHKVFKQKRGNFFEKKTAF